ncbi:MAG: ABC transporter substrate-binding protein [Lachnospiraceae bacterium]
MKIKLVILFALFICMVACGKKTEDSQEEKTVMVLATFEGSTILKTQVEQYNQKNADYRIEIKHYERSEDPKEDGILLLQREIVLGEGPDLIDFGNGYTTSDIVGGYTEDLFLYLDEKERQAYFENMVEAFSYREKLYALPLGFCLESFVGTKQNLGNAESWSIGEMLECYQKQKEERGLYPGAFKADVLGTILTGSMDYYIDWETGECYFNGKEFCEVLKFCNEFPEHLEIEDNFSVKQIFLEDKALLLPIKIQSIYDICRAEYIFGEQEISFIGFPVEGTNGTMAQPSGPVLAICQTSQHKEAAWKFIQQCLGDSCQGELPFGFPIRRSTLEEQLFQEQKIEYETDENGQQKPMVKEQVIFEGEEPVDLYCITEKQAEDLLVLIEQAEMSSRIDSKIYKVFFEEADYYFTGERSLEETTSIIQSIVSIYVNEKIR